MARRAEALTPHSNVMEQRMSVRRAAQGAGTLALAGAAVFSLSACSFGGAASEDTPSIALYVACENPEAEVFAIADPDGKTTQSRPFDPNANLYNEIYPECINPDGSRSDAFVNAAIGFDGQPHEPGATPSGNEPNAIVTIYYNDSDGPDRFTPQKLVGGRQDSAYAPVTQEDDYVVNRVAFDGVTLTPDDLLIESY